MQAGCYGFGQRAFRVGQEGGAIAGAIIYSVILYLTDQKGPGMPSNPLITPDEISFIPAAVRTA